MHRTLIKSLMVAFRMKMHAFLCFDLPDGRVEVAVMPNSEVSQVALCSSYICVCVCACVHIHERVNGVVHSN